jgi:nucleotide-binding universal stress UspA family protein
MGVRLLLAIDQFEPGHAAVDFTIGFAARLEADVCVFHVREVPSSLGIDPLESQAEARELVERVVQRLQVAGIGVEGRTCSDHASCVARLIVEEAAERHCGAIVLGSLRLRGL